VCDGLPARGPESTEGHGASQVDHVIKREETPTENQAKEAIIKVGLIPSYKY